MRQLIVFMVVLAGIVFAVGLYRNWFEVGAASAPGPVSGKDQKPSDTKQSQSDKIDVRLTVDKSKISEDAQSIKKSTENALEAVKGTFTSNKEPSTSPKAPSDTEIRPGFSGVDVAEPVPAAPATTTLAGKVRAIDEKRQELTVQTKDKGSVDISVTKETKIVVNGKPGTFGEIRMGDALTSDVKKSDEAKKLAMKVNIDRKADE